MKKRKMHSTPVITVPKGYSLFDLIDTDDKGYGFDKPIVQEEVKIEFERNDGAEQ